MLGLRKLIVWTVLLIAGYYGLDYVKVHTSSDVIAYKRFAKALMENDYYSARRTSNNELAARVLKRNEERLKAYRGGRVLFTYYEVISQNQSSDGKTSSLVADQVSRVASNGQTGIWGDAEIRIRHRVELAQENQIWKVSSFTDPAMR